jgi:hypothetical protein
MLKIQLADQTKSPVVLMKNYSVCLLMDDITEILFKVSLNTINQHIPCAFQWTLFSPLLTVLTLEFCFVLIWFWNIFWLCLVFLLFFKMFSLFLDFSVHLVDCFDCLCVRIFSECFDRHEFATTCSVLSLCLCWCIFFGVCPNIFVGLWYCILVHENITSMLPSKHSRAFWWCLFQRTFC